MRLSGAQCIHLSMKPLPFDPIEVALAEDIGAGDITTDILVPETLRSSARIVAREKACIAGSETTAKVFRRVDESIHIEIIRADGSEVDAGESVLEIRGLARSILKAERTALNFLQHLSGIASLTARFVAAAANKRVKILDTRKTTPGLRKLEKAAVVAGGGNNHRFGLFDMVLVKDNHIASSGGFSDFAERIQNIRKAHPEVRVEIEADNLEQVRQFVELDGVDVILLDNMPPAQMREAVALRKNSIKFEASGGITLENVRRIAATGVDYISIGALTQSARAVDFSLEITHVGG
jgi:nicotinate-nucleotide pyrophosphorylase (carboxylating)